MPLLLSGCAQQSVSFDPPVPRGHVVARPGRAGFVIAAPHGTTDPFTGDFAAELARRTGFGLVVAAGSGPSLAYEQRVQEAAQGRLAFYAEIHGNNRRESANRIEVATVGVDHGLALRLRTLYELIRDVHLRGAPGAPKLEILIEPADKIFYAASGSQRDGILRLSARALHLELPRAARMDIREPYTAILAEFLAQAATLPAGR